MPHPVEHHKSNSASRSHSAIFLNASITVIEVIGEAWRPRVELAFGDHSQIFSIASVVEMAFDNT